MLPADAAAVLAYNDRAARDPSFTVPVYLAQFIAGKMRTWPHMHHQAAGWGSGALITCGFLWFLHGRVSRSWFAAFLVAALGVLILAVGHIVSFVLAVRGIAMPGLNRQFVHLYAIGVAFAAIAVASALAADLRSGARTDNLHYVGVSAWLGIAAIQLGTYAAFLWL